MAPRDLLSRIGDGLHSRCTRPISHPSILRRVRSLPTRARRQSCGRCDPIRSGRRARDGSWRASFWNSVAVQKGGVATSGTEQGGVGAGAWPFAVVRANAEGHQEAAADSSARVPFRLVTVVHARGRACRRPAGRSRGGTSTTVHEGRAAHRHFALLLGLFLMHPQHSALRHAVSTSACPAAMQTCRAKVSYGIIVAPLQ